MPVAEGEHRVHNPRTVREFAHPETELELAQ